MNIEVATVTAGPSAAPAEAVIRRNMLFVFALPAVLQGFLHAPTQSLIQGIYAKHVGVSLAALGTAVLISRIFDAVIDPFIGAASDAWRNRSGSHKHFIAAGTVITVFGLWNLFQPPQGAGATYFALWYIVASLGWSVIEIPYKTWSMQLSSEYVTRTRIQTWIAVAVIFGTFVFFAVPLVAQSAGLADTAEFNLQSLALAATLVAFVMPVVNFAALWRMPSGAAQPHVPRLSVRQTRRVLVGNGPFVYFTLMFLLCGITSGINQGVNYLFIDGYLGLGKHLAAVMLLASPAMLIAIPVWGVLCQRWERQKVWAISLAVVSLCQAACAFVPVGEAGLGAVTALTLAIVLFVPCIFVAGPAMVGDLIDYGRWKFGEDHGGLYIAFFSIAQMTVNALGTALGLILLNWLGYDATAAVQGEQGARAMQIVVSWIPALGTAISVPLVWRYPLRRARHAEIMAEMARRAEPARTELGAS